MNLDTCKVIADSRWKLFRHGRTTIKELCVLLQSSIGEAETLRTQIEVERKISEALRANEANANAVIALQDRQAAEAKTLRDQLEAQQRENRTLTEFSAELRQNIEDARGNIRRLQDEKHLVEVELSALTKHLEAQRIGNGKLTTLIRRRLRPDGMPERLNAITHQNFRQ